MTKPLLDNLWDDTGGESFSAEPLHEHVDADIVIIGGGYTGLATALSAGERGAKAIVLEAHDIGFGGSGRNVGLVNAGLWLPPEQINEALGPTIGSRLSSILGNAPELVFGWIDKYGINCDPVRAGTLHCAHSKSGFAEIEDRHRQMKAIGAPVQVLDADETLARTGARRIHGALFDPRAGTLHPKAYARGLARAATEVGAHIYENSPALSVGWEDGLWEVATPTGFVRAKSLLIATNAYPFKMSWVHPLKSVPVSYFQAATIPLPQDLRTRILSGGEGCWDTAMVMSSWRLDAEGRLLIGGMGQLSHMGGNVHANWVRRKLGHLFPELKGIDLTHHWQGRIAMTRDKLPKIWRLGPSAYACFGYSGRGIGPGSAFGQRLAPCLLDQNEEILPLVPVNANHTRATRLTGAVIEAGTTLTHFVKNRF